MKTQTTKKIKGVLMTMGFGMLSFAGMSQEHMTMSMENVTSTKNTIEYDLYIVNDGSTSIKLAACAYGINYNPAILNGVTPGAAANQVAANSRTRALNSLSEYSLLNTNKDHFNQLRMTMKPVRLTDAVELQANVPYKVGHFKFTNTKDWAVNSNPMFALNEFNVPGISTSCATGYIDGNTNPKGFSVAQKNLSVKVVNSPILNPSMNLPQANTSAQGSAENASQLMNAANVAISIYPNPTQDVVNIDLNANELSNITIKVSDIRGRIVKQIQGRSEKGMNTLSVSLREVPAGVYNVQVFQDSKLSYTGKVTKE